MFNFVCKIRFYIHIYKLEKSLGQSGGWIRVIGRPATKQPQVDPEKWPAFAGPSGTTLPPPPRGPSWPSGFSSRIARFEQSHLRDAADAKRAPLRAQMNKRSISLASMT